MTDLQNETGQNFDREIWKLIMYRGIVLLIAGLILTFFPEGTLTTLVFIMGIFWLIDGILTTYKSIKGRKIFTEWKWGLITGIIGIVAGLVALFQPTLTSYLSTSFIIWFLGLAALVYGIGGLVTGFKMPKKTKGKTNMILGGILSILFGAILISSPYYSAIALIKTIGIVALVGGVVLLLVAFGIKKTIEKA